MRQNQPTTAIVRVRPHVYMCMTLMYWYSYNKHTWVYFRSVQRTSDTITIGLTFLIWIVINMNVFTHSSHDDSSNEISSLLNVLMKRCISISRCRIITSFDYVRHRSIEIICVLVVHFTIDQCRTCKRLSNATEQEDACDCSMIRMMSVTFVFMYSFGNKRIKMIQSIMLLIVEWWK
jgi:hypothetical protein